MNDCHCAVYPHLWLRSGKPRWGPPEPNDSCQCGHMKFADVPAWGIYWVYFLEAETQAGPLERKK